MYKVSEKPLVSTEEIEKRLIVLAKEVDASGEYDLVLGVLTGAFIFVADLVRNLSCNPNISFIKASSYGNSTESSNVVVQGLENLCLENKRILLVDDILDTGKTFFALVEQLKKLGAKTVKTCVLLDKPSRREVNIEADFVGFSIENKFVVGYGLDYAENHRSLNGIFTLEQLE
ncbi:MAG: hypoxanthine phosphoribosyltransferase [Fibrobacteraceae bacterium]|nr:hypoxanthine phosphoribosyltransferase [Fibrobacteraceae bacterium]